MNQGTLGTPYRFSYASKNFTSGLTNISAKVLRPDGSYMGTYVLMEDADSYFTGSYSFDFLTTQLMPEGEYLVAVREPTSGHKAFRTLRMTLPVESGADNSPIDLVGTIVQNGIINGIVGATGVIIGKVISPIIAGAVDSGAIITGNLLAPEIVGIVSTSGVITGQILEC